MDSRDYLGIRANSQKVTQDPVNVYDRHAAGVRSDPNRCIDHPRSPPALCTACGPGSETK